MHNEELILIKGTLSGFKSAPGKINLLEQLRNHNTAKNITTGVVGALTDMYGMVSNSAMLAMYDGEDVENFIGVLDGKVIYGVFEHADLLADGDNIEALIIPDGDIFAVESIIRPKDGLILVPLITFSGTKARWKSEVKDNIKFLLFFSVIALAGIALSAFEGTVRPDWDLWAYTKLYFLLMAVLAAGVFIFGTYFFYKDQVPPAKRAERIFKGFGFPDPENFCLLPGLQAVGITYSRPAAFNYQTAIAIFEGKPTPPVVPFALPVAASEAPPTRKKNKKQNG